MIKFFSRNKNKAPKNRDSELKEKNRFVRFESYDNYIEIFFQVWNADKTKGEYIYDTEGAWARIGKPKDKSDDFIKYSIFEYAIDSMDYVSKGDSIFVLRRDENDYVKEISNEVLVLPQVISPADGIVEVIINEKGQISDNDLICRIHFNLETDKANSPLNNIYQGKFDKYEIPKQVRDLNLITGKFIFLTKWLVENGTEVKAGDKIFEVKGGSSDRHFFSYELKSKASGIIEFIKAPTEVFISDELKQKELLYLIFKSKEIRFNHLYSNEINIQVDEFNNSKTIKWNVVGGLKYPFNSDSYNPIGGIITDSPEGKSLIFSFQNQSSKDFIVFNFFSKEYKLTVNDKVNFLFDDNELISFTISEKSYKLNSNWKQLFETKVPITFEELNSFKNKRLEKWRIESASSNQAISGIGNNDWYHDDNFQKVIHNLTSEYLDAVASHIENYSPLRNKMESKCDVPEKNEDCYVYLMIDTTNNFHKIGISNSPEYRERTLQSDKPTIELICSKKFPSRRIAESIEKALHTTFAKKRLRGEWFELNSDEIDEIKETLV
jgi:hypothetical protein